MNDASEVNVAVERESIWNRAFIKVFVMYLLLNMGLFMTNAMVPKYAEHLGATAAVIGMVTSLFAITSLGIRPIVGPSTSYFRNNQVLAFAVGITILSFAFYGLANSIETVIAGRLLHGIGMGFLAPVSLALASDALPKSKIASGIGIFSLGQAIATALGPVVGMELMNQFGYQTTFFVGAVIMGIVFVLSIRLKSVRPERTAGFKIKLSDIVAKEVMVPSMIMFFLASSYSCINSFILIYGGIAGVNEIGLFFTSYAICLFISRPFSGKIADQYGVDKTIIPGIIIFALSFVLISYSRTLPMFVFAGAVSAFGYGICQPSIQTLCMKLVSRERRGVAGNTNYIGVDLGYLIAPSLAGMIVAFVQSHGGTEFDGYATMFRLMTIPIIIALIIFLWKGRAVLMKIKETEGS